MKPILSIALMLRATAEPLSTLGLRRHVSVKDFKLFIHAQNLDCSSEVWNIAFQF